MLDGLLRNSLHIFRVSWIWFSARSRSRISRPVKYGSIHKMNRTRLLYIFSNMVIRHFIWNFSSDTWCIAVRFHLRANSVQLTNSTAACHHLTSSRALIDLPIATSGFRPKSWYCYWILRAVVLPVWQSVQQSERKKKCRRTTYLANKHTFALAWVPSWYIHLFSITAYPAYRVMRLEVGYTMDKSPHRAT